MSKATRERDAIINNLERGQIRKTGSTDQSKRVKRDQTFFMQGVNLGAQLALARVHNSVAGLDYGAAYYVPPVVSENLEGASVGSAGDSGVDDADHTDLRSGYTGDPYMGEHDHQLGYQQLP